MKIFFSNVLKLGIAMLLLQIAIPAFAESAPVYDADQLDQQFARDDQGVDYPPPPPPDQGGMFDQNDQNQAPPSSAGPMDPTGSAGPRIDTDFDQRVRRVEQQINNMQNNDFTTRLDALQNEVQSLRGQMEQMMHEMQQLQNQQKSMYGDLDKRLTEREIQSPGTNLAENGAAAAKPLPNANNNPNHPPSSSSSPDVAKREESYTPVSPSLRNRKANKITLSTYSDANSSDDNTSRGGQLNVAEEQKIYQTAYNLIKAKNYNEAVKILQNMLKKYPSGQFASNAHYWLGELYGLMGKNDNALSEFNAVLNSYPTSPRVSDAQLKVGLIYAAQFNWSHAKAAFRKVISHYPGTASARLASEQLKQIRRAGH